MTDPSYRTCLEKQMAGYLKAIGLEFAEQYSLRSGSVLDFLVQFKKPDGTTFSVDVETDGSNWHHTTSQRQRDIMRDKTTRAMGIEVVRFREGFNCHQVYGTLVQVARRNGVVNFPPFPEVTGD
jgi:very-short-patch-repair endonuclease